VRLNDKQNSYSPSIARSLHTYPQDDNLQVQPVKEYCKGNILVPYSESLSDSLFIVGVGDGLLNIDWGPLLLLRRGLGRGRGSNAEGSNGPWAFLLKGRVVVEDH
jgi:hypothetical protein